MRRKDIERLEKMKTRKGGDVCPVYTRKHGTSPVALRLVRMAQPGEIATWRASVHTPHREKYQLDRGSHHVLVVDLTVKYTGCAYSGDGFEWQVISDSALADDAEMTIDIDQVGSTVAGVGLKVGLYVRRQ